MCVERKRTVIQTVRSADKTWNLRLALCARPVSDTNGPAHARGCVAASLVVSAQKQRRELPPKSPNCPGTRRCKSSENVIGHCRKPPGSEVRIYAMRHHVTQKSLDGRSTAARRCEAQCKHGFKLLFVQNRSEQCHGCVVGTTTVLGWTTIAVLGFIHCDLPAV